jgi:hypothetical protein
MALDRRGASTGQSCGACEFAGARLDSSPQHLPGAVAAAVVSVVAAWKTDGAGAVSVCLGQAFESAQELGYL